MFEKVTDNHAGLWYLACEELTRYTHNQNQAQTYKLTRAGMQRRTHACTCTRARTRKHKAESESNRENEGKERERKREREPNIST